MHYVHVENGEIKGFPMPLPKSWGNISNFDLLDDQSLRQYGWYKYTFVPAQQTETNYTDGSTVVITEDGVIEYQLLKEKTEEQIQKEIESRWENIRSQRNVYLLESDWTQLEDSPLLAQIKEEWRVYRQALRDITNFATPDEVVWPEKPSDELRTSVQPNGEVS